MWNVSNGALILTLDSSDSNPVKLPLPLDPTGNTTKAHAFPTHQSKA